MKIIISSLFIMFSIMPLNDQRTTFQDKIEVDVKVSDSFINRLSRYLNVNLTTIEFSIKNSSPENVVIQKPIINWNLFLRMYDLEGNEIFTSRIEFIDPIIKAADFIELSENQSISYKFKLDFFGSFNTNFRNIKEIEIVYKPQYSVMNKEYPKLVLEKTNATEILNN